jgi:hypothetical protein
MPKVLLEGFECSRCGHRWFPRENAAPPVTCPKCKSPYWDKPRRDDILPEYRVKCARTKPELDGKSVEYKLRKGKKIIEGEGRFDVSDLGDGFLQISILNPLDPDHKILLNQDEADSIQTHWGRFRYKCFSPM